MVTTVSRRLPRAPIRASPPALRSQFFGRPTRSSSPTVNNYTKFLADARTDQWLPDRHDADRFPGRYGYELRSYRRSPGDVTLLNAPTVDQQNTAGTTTGTGFGTPSWTGQTFIPAVTAHLVKVDVQLFCSGCTGTTPNLTLSVRATSAGLPTGADLASASIPGFSSSAGRPQLHCHIRLAGHPDIRNTICADLASCAAPSAGGVFLDSLFAEHVCQWPACTFDLIAAQRGLQIRPETLTLRPTCRPASRHQVISSHQSKDANPDSTFQAEWSTISSDSLDTRGHQYPVPGGRE